MIEAAKSALFTRWFARHAERRLRRTFAAVRVRGLDTAREALAAGPVLVVSNHTAWWDPLVALVLCERFWSADAYAMMDARNLRKLPFFAKFGAFGVALDDPADGARALRYAARRLVGPGSLVWIFPQGREVPVSARPLGFRGGSAQLARVAKAASVLPVALRYEHGATPDPTVWIAIGDALGRPARGAHLTQIVHDQENAVLAELDRIERALVANEADAFPALLKKRDSPWSALAETLLAWLTRPRALR